MSEHHLETCLSNRLSMSVHTKAAQEVVQEALARHHQESASPDHAHQVGHLAVEVKSQPLQQLQVKAQCRRKLVVKLHHNMESTVKHGNMEASQHHGSMEVHQHRGNMAKSQQDGEHEQSLIAASHEKL